MNHSSDTHSPVFGRRGGTSLWAMLTRVARAPQTMLVLATLLWGGNFVVGRLLRQDITPLALTFWRWALALVILLPLSWNEIRSNWRLVLRSWRLFLALGATGIAAYTLFIYEALHVTTTLNAALFAALLPLAILVAGRVLNGEPIARRQLGSIALSLVGALIIVVRGNPAALLALHVNVGDLWMLGAVPLWAVYAVLQKRRPPAISPLTLATLSVVAGVLLLLPPYLWALLWVEQTHLTLSGALGLLYIAVGASAVAYVFWNRGAARIGPSRAGIYTNLIPVFSAAGAVVLLGEHLAAYHLLGAALVAGGIILTNTRAAPRPESVTASQQRPTAG